MPVREADSPCPACYGRGARVYSSTSTWRGGVGGCMITEDVCDRCWGSGDAAAPWTNIRAAEAHIRSLEARVKLLPAFVGPAAEGVRVLMDWVYGVGGHRRGCPAYGDALEGSDCTCGFSAAKQAAYDVATAMASLPKEGQADG